METQNQIKRTLKQTEAIEQIKRMLDDTDNANRTQLADGICDQSGFFAPRGKKQRSGCLKAIRELEKEGKFILPAPCGSWGKKLPRGLSEPVPEASPAKRQRQKE